jgi:hypothetical protein
MRTGLLTIAALVGASALTLNAQQTSPPPQPPRTGDTTQRTAAAAAEQTITITGCLKAEKDVPGRSPNAAAPAGVTEDYVLTSVKMAPASKVSGIGLVSTYQIEGIAEAELQKHLNHEVEVTGRITQAAMTETKPATDVPGFQATSLKMVSATCPAQ